MTSYSCFSGFFSANGLPTIVPSGDVKNMGQRVKMTQTDIERVHHLYSCGVFRLYTLTNIWLLLIKRLTLNTSLHQLHETC